MRGIAAEEKSESIKERTLQTSGSVKEGERFQVLEHSLVSPAAHGEDPGETGCLLQPVMDLMLEKVDVPEGSCDCVGSLHWSRFAGRVCDPTGALCWSCLFLKDCTLGRGSYTGTVHAEPQPMGRIPVG